MIRRAIWLAVGAILGILGYRRLDGLVRSISGQHLALPARRRPAGLSDLRDRGLAGDWRSAGRKRGTGAGEFLRDVADGMADYMDRHSGRSGNTLVGQQVRAGLRAVPGSDNLKDGR
jgi:hypothetical protein